MNNIIKKPSPNFSSRNGYRPELIVVHISTSTMVSMDDWFASKASLVSAHYGVGRDGSISQYVDESNGAWGNGKLGNPSFKLNKGININPNLYTISIENEGEDLMKGTLAQLSSLRDLIQDICTRNNIPMDRDHIIGHYEIDSIRRNFCPSTTHSIMDVLVASLQSDLVSIMCPRSKVQAVTEFIKTLK